MGAGWMKIKEWTRRIDMGRYKYTLSYDSRDQENAMVCGILAALGNKRSAVVRELIMDAVRRYGVDVLRKENVNVLIYLISHTDMTGIVQQPVISSTDRDERMLTFPPEKRQISRKKEPEIRNVKAVDKESNKDTEISVSQKKSGERKLEKEAEAVRDPFRESQENESEDGTNPLLNFLNVRIYEER